MATSPTSPRPIHLFVAYARADEEFRRELLKTLADWKREGLIVDIWSDREIAPGKEWDDAIKDALNAADLILVLMSRDSIASQYIASVEIVRALERHERREARVVPVVIRSCDWTSTKLGRLQAVPASAKPLSKYADPDDFWLDVKNELKKVVLELNNARAQAAGAPLPASEIPATLTSAPEHRAAIGSTPGEVRTNPADGQPYVWIPPGEFLMGASPDNKEAYPDEKPLHRVEITRGFWIGQTPVTVDAYRRFVTVTKGQMPKEPSFAQTGRHPVVNVDWNAAAAYCQWAGGHLPSEAEWEYAARAGNASPRYGQLEKIAWFDKNAGGATHPVAQLEPNAYGLCDTLGNVWEWCSDWFADSYYKTSPPKDPRGPDKGTSRSLRGGSWYDFAWDARVSFRSRNHPGFRDNNLGFRCVREVIP
jgi:formylglycine-generating enzyme required for sulfatase activity